MKGLTGVIHPCQDSHMTTTIETQTVTAELAPLGVQLWPTRSPEYADNFTLANVAVVRTESDEINGRPNGHVVWTYRNGSTRTFALGEQIVAQF